MDHILEKLFESVPKVRVLRLFLQNPEEEFTLREIQGRTKLRPITLRRELMKLGKLGLVKEKQRMSARKGKSGKERMSRKLMHFYSVDQTFPLFQELHTLVVQAFTVPRKKLLTGIKTLGRVHLAVLCGTFVQSENGRTDLLIVGERIKKSELSRLLSDIESELGKSIRYTLMDLKEFRYRLDMYDRFLRDILEYPHEKLINKLNL